MPDDSHVTARKFRWRPRFGIGARIILLSAVAVAGLLAVVGLEIYSDARNDAALDRARQYADLSAMVARVDSGVLQMRRYEKDLLLRRKENYVGLYGVAARDVLAELDEIAALPIGDEVAPFVAPIRQSVGDHVNMFHALVELTRELGYGEADGLHGTLRDAVHEVEGHLEEHGDDAVTIAMLMMRRHEKDFIMRGDDIYIERFDRQYEVFNSLLAESSMAEAPKYGFSKHKPEIARHMDQYVADFHVYVERYRQAAAARRSLRAIHGEIDPPLDAILAYAQKSQSRAESIRVNEYKATRVTVIGAGISVLAILLVLEVLLARDITRRIKSLTRTMMALAGGDKAVDIPSTGATDEIGDMARAVIVFKENMNETDRLVAARDAERERTEQRLRQLTISRTRFFAAASHDLRQPLHAMALYLPILEEEMGGELSGDAVRAIGNACDTMDALLDTLLDISKLDAGAVEPKTGRVPIADIFDQLAMEFAPQATARSLELRVVPCSVWGVSDATLLLRILRNLLVNAIRYTPRGTVLLGVRRRAGRLHLEVWDTGIGIAADNLRQIFGEFYQVKDGGSERDRSLGLGLSIVDRLAHLLDHRIHVRSWPGKGSVFSLELPRAEAPAQRGDNRGRAPLRQRDMAGVRVVLIDDDADVLKGMEVLLNSWGCEVLVADSVAGAVDGVASDERIPDLILADFVLRDGETGLQAIEQIRDAAEFPVPAIIITATIGSEELREAAASGYMIMHKPLKPDQLRLAMETTLPPAREEGGHDTPFHAAPAVIGDEVRVNWCDKQGMDTDGEIRKAGK